MADNLFTSTAEYADQKGISRMQVNRLIRSGKIPAEKVGNTWVIYQDPAKVDQKSPGKTTSLQMWNKVTQNVLGKKLDVERTKDRELIFAKMHSLGLPHEKSFSFPKGGFPTEKEFKTIIDRIGLPYWISAVPTGNSSHLNRQTKLKITSEKEGWEFINHLPSKNEYKIIVTQYPERPEFKGTALISHQGNGIAEFITGDRHVIMTRGFANTNPMLFNSKEILKFSDTVSKENQKELFNLIKGITGHFEFQHGSLEGQKRLTFFDYNSQNAYIDIDKTWQNLIDYFQSQPKADLFGLPTSPGKAKGSAFVTHHESVNIYNQPPENAVIVTDTLIPKMAPLLKRAKAIVTDTGGATTHPAIVCRELKIPTIVGTEKATSLLRNGDKLSVDANKGVIFKMQLRNAAS